MHSLYRKYRPTKLADVVGQSGVTTALQNALDQNKIGHAYLFIGPRGTGKTSVARIFAHAINKFDYQLEDNYLDIIEIDAASNNGVDNIRDLREKAIIAPSTGQYKVYIIDEVHMLSKSAANALLKTLEEPPAHTIFIMATTEADKIPITITSRTQLYNFKLASPEVMAEHLTKIAKLEKINIAPDAIAIVAERSGGSFRDALSLLEQVASLAGDRKTPIDADFLRNAFGLPSDQIAHNLLNSYATGDLTTIQNELQDLLNSGLSPENIARELINKILHNPQPVFLPLLAQLPNVQPPFPEAKLLLALCANVPKSTTTVPAATPVTISPTENRTSAPENHAPTTSNHADKTKNHAPESGDRAIKDENHAPSPQKHAPASNADFNWNNFLDTVRSESSGAADQLQKCQHELEGDTLHIYPSNKFIAKTLASPAHSAAINSALNGLALEIHESPKPTTLSPELAQVAEIMGDVQELPEGDLPF